MSKWELIEEDVAGIRQVSNPILGVVSKTPARWDVFRKKKRNGTYKYKKVER